MKTRAIAKVVVEAPGTLYVYPQVEEPVGYEYIYREANGLRWAGERRALYAHEPLRWEHEELLRHMAVALREAFDEELVFTDQTAWHGVSPDVQAKLRKVLERCP
jgi:hypothetical protein